MASFRLTPRAEQDLLSIFIYGIERFGEVQAERYSDGLDRCFKLMALQPRMGRLARSVRPGVRRHEHGSHVILYEEVADGVLILALVHARSIRRLTL